MAKLKTKKILDLAAARQIIKRATTKAEELKVGGAVAVVDDGGHLITLDTLDGSMPAAAEIAIGKAATAAVFRRPTSKIEEVIQNSRLPMLTLGGVIQTPYAPLDGAYPIMLEGKCVGAVSVAGAASAENDELIAAHASEWKPD
ncbi:MAG: heme-binding protein [Fibrobacteria bacterium]|nr:heme-binding protein [Fibrobacteria bacterium]